MKIAFVTELFPPFTSGGGEWSIYYLAQDLAKKGLEVIILTPNYGTKRVSYLNGVKIIRYPFYFKLKNKNIPGNFAFTNPFWVIWSACFLFYYFLKENVEIINVHQKYSIIPAFFANLFIRKPMVATLRDYIHICNYGLCLVDSNRACNFKKYFTDDFKKYYEIYVRNKNILNLTLNIIYALWGRISSFSIKFFINQYDVVTALSKRSKIIYEVNGINKDVRVIRNSFEFPPNLKYTKPGRTILYIGRLTYGKGVGLILNAILLVAKKYPQIVFLFAGKGDLEQKIKEISSKAKNVSLLGLVEHKKLNDYYAKALLVLIPSIWPEPFARTTIESIASGTPVIVSDRGGMAEFVSEGNYGYVAKRTDTDLAAKILKGLKHNQTLRKKISKDYTKIKKQFSENPAKQFMQIYSILLKKEIIFEQQ